MSLTRSIVIEIYAALQKTFDKASTKLKNKRTTPDVRITFSGLF